MTKLIIPSVCELANNVRLLTLSRRFADPGKSRNLLRMMQSGLWLGGAANSEMVAESKPCAWPKLQIRHGLRNVANSNEAGAHLWVTVDPFLHS